MRVFALLAKVFVMMTVATLMAGFVQISPARAVPGSTAPPTIKYHSPHIMKSHFAAPQAAASNGQDLLLYNDGPVMKNSVSYAIFWEPTTSPDGCATGGTATWHFSADAGIESSPIVVQPG